MPTYEITDPQTGQTLAIDGESEPTEQELNDIFSQMAGAAEIAAGNIDRKTGAPAGVRSAVAAAKTPQDKLGTLQQFYPDARFYDDENMVFTHPATGQPTLFNPEGLDVGDIVEFGRSGAEFIGGAIGAGGAVLAGNIGPQAAVPEEVVTVPAAAGTGATIAGNVYDLVTKSIFPVQDTRSAVEVLGDEGATFVLNAAGQKLGEYIETGLGAFKSRAGRLVAKTSDEIRDAFSRIRATPTAGAVSTSETIQGIEQALSRLPVSADIVGAKYAKTVSEMDDFVKATASRLSTREGAEQVGRSLQTGIDKFVTKFKTQGSQLYDDLWQKMPGSSRVAIDNFKSTLDNISGQFADDPAYQALLDSKVIAGLKNATDAASEKGGVTVNTLKALRSKIGAALDDKNLVADTSQAELKRLYGALSDDIAAAAGSFGDDAARAFERANTYWAAGRSRIDDVLNPMAKSANAERLYSKVFGPEGQVLKKVPASEMRALMRSLPREEQAAVTAEFVRRMGQTTPGRAGAEGAIEFSPAQYLTQYNRMSEGAKKAVFDGVPGLRQALDDLATASAAIKETHQMANTSGTAGQLFFMSLLTGGVGGAYGGAEGAGVGVAAVLAPGAAAKLMTSPRFVNWLADAATTPLTSGAGIGGHIGRLAAIAEAEPAVKEEIMQYMQAMRSYTQGDNNGQ